MALDNAQIAAKVALLATAIRKGERPLEADEEVALKAGIDLVISVLQNLNDIAGHARGDF